ncbi:carboxylesterase/lipase family protein [Saccharopolyspora gloriosae]|uniref:carboxylesterase/lipase family protein n=1 Tax=Saccharopolyspora gloriosae TaxID=455344 RepID=UPI001FB73922|nr:carboxylesterase family protein [Saccharopolyspora gloriosae]
MPDPIVPTTSGRVRGHHRGEVARFHAVPYAAAPVGRLRFAAPQPAPAWDGIRDATRPATIPPQAPGAELDDLDLSPLRGPDWDGGHDYLTVEVSTPDPAAGGLPVLVFVHGGAFISGTGSAPLYDGAAFARSGAVLMTINHRLGAEGFAPIGATNVGLRDQLAALRWVRQNAAAFGGDPGNVTVFGQSSGAMSIADLLGSPLLGGLVDRAIVQSGHTGMTRGLDAGSRLTEALAQQLSIPASTDAFRGVELERLLAAQTAISAPGHGPDLRDEHGHDPSFGLSAFLPLHGDDVLPQPPGDAVAAGSATGVDVLVSTCRDEMSLYSAPTGAADALTDELAVATLATSHPAAAEVLQSYGLGRRPAGAVLTEALTDLVFRLPAREFAARHRDAGGRTHVAEFTWRSPRFGGRLGACHGLELPFVFHNLHVATGPHGLLGESPDAELADTLHRAWVSFAATGDPGWPDHHDDHVFIAGPDPATA